MLRAALSLYMFSPAPHDIPHTPSLPHIPVRPPGIPHQSSPPPHSLLLLLQIPVLPRNQKFAEIDETNTQLRISR